MSAVRAPEQRGQVVPMRRKASYTQVSTAILRDRGLSAGARLLYALLLSYAWQEGICFPDEATLSADMAMGVRQVRRYRDELLVAGLLVVRRRGQGKSNLYAFPTPTETADAAVSDRSDLSALDRSDLSGQTDEGTETTHPDRSDLSALDGTFMTAPIEEDEDSLTKTQWVTPADAGGADAPRAAPQPHEQTQTETRSPPYLVAEALIEARLGKATPGAVRRLLRSVTEEVTQPFTGAATVADAKGCLAWMATKPYYAEDLTRISARKLAEELGPWLKAGRPPTYRQNGQRASPAGPQFDRDPTPNAPPDAVMCWCNTIEGYRHGRGCNLKGLVTKDNYRDPGDWTIRHTPAGVVRDPLPDDGGGT
jgi:hypothetical protein